MVEKLSDILLNENTRPVEFILTKNYEEIIKEDSEYIPKPEAPGVPRFTIKGIEGIEDIPINKPIKQRTRKSNIPNGCRSFFNW